MTSRFARLSSVALMLAVVHGVSAQGSNSPLPQNPRPNPAPAQGVTPPPPTVGAPAAAPAGPAAVGAREEEPPVTLKLPDADIDTVLAALELYTGKVILRPSQLQTQPGGYNLKITKPIPKSQAILYLETILAMNQIAVVPLGKDALKIVQLGQARIEAPELILGSAAELPPSSKIASKLFQLDFIRSAEFVQMLGNIINPVFGSPIALANANAVLITDTVTNLQRIETVQQQVDRPLATGLGTKFYQLRNGAKASDMVAKIRAILPATMQTQLATTTTYSADDRTNQIIIITDPRQFPFFDGLIEKLDVKADPNTRNEVIYLRHAKADAVVTVLVNIIRGQSQVAQRAGSTRPTQPLQPNTPAQPQQLGAPTAPPQPTVISGSGSANPALDQGGTNEFSSLVTVVNDDRSNSVVVSGTVDDIRLLQELIDKLDIVLAQVRIEVVIAEVTLDDNHDSGISQLGLQLDGDKLVGFGATGAGFGVAGTAGTGFATINRPGGSVSVSGRWDLAGTISLNTTKRKNNTTILTVPAIVTSHGKKASINDGETRPVITGVTNYAGVGSTGATTSSQVTQQNIGTTLTVTPFIGNDGTIQLDIEQELTDVIDTVTVDNNTQYVIGTRKATSYVTARSGEIHVLGGFRKAIDSKQSNRLGPIPIIGDLLGSRKKDKYHQELIFFLRPIVLTNDSAVDNAEVLKQVEQLPTRDEIKGQLDPSFQAPKRSVLDKILPR